MRTDGPLRCNPALGAEPLVQGLLERFRAETGIDLRGDAMASERLHNAAGIALSQLQGEEEVEVNLPFLTADSSGPKHLQVRVTRG